MFLRLVAILILSSDGSTVADDARSLTTPVLARTSFQDYDDRQILTSITQVAILMRKLHPDYDRWTLADIDAKLFPPEARFIRGRAGQGFNFDALVPKRLLAEYGNHARATMIRHVISAANKRHEPRGYADGVLKGIIGTESKLSAEALSGVNCDPQVTLINASGRLTTASANEIVTYAMAQAMTAPETAHDQAVRVTIPIEVMRAIVAANPILPKSVAERAPQYDVTATVAYDVGMTIASGHASRVGAVHFPALPPKSQACVGMPPMEDYIYNHQKPALEVSRGFVLGYMRATIGECG